MLPTELQPSPDAVLVRFSPLRDLEGIGNQNLIGWECLSSWLNLRKLNVSHCGMKTEDKKTNLALGAYFLFPFSRVPPPSLIVDAFQR